MDIPFIRGRVAKQAHVGLPEGTVEEEYARNGFFGRYAHLYRTAAPVAWSRIEGPLKPRAFDLNRLEARADDFVAARSRLLSNADARVSMVSLSAPMAYFFRNADADELFFVHQGAGRLETDFGPLAYEPGDYLLIPRGTAYRFCPTSPSRWLLVETESELEVPDRGMLGQHALFDPAALRAPTPEASTMTPNADGEFELRIARRGTLTKVFYPENPLNVVGYKGTLTVLGLNVRDIRPVLSDRYHLPPSAHTTFVARNVAICTFAPRPLENGDPAALKVPFYHSNIDFDEVLFYHAGEFFSRDGIAPGMLTLHPQGIQHGPQARAKDRASAATRTEEVAVMIDTKNTLDVESPMLSTERPDYWMSWKEDRKCTTR
jgi:homogentisate 1,2-dioxygenase